MEYNELKRMLQHYNWDDGFDIPSQILSDASCDLALALEIFYLGDGFRYFQAMTHGIDTTEKWFCFIRNQYHSIQSGAFQKTGHSYKIPLSNTQRYQLRKNNIPEQFLADL